MIEILVEAWEQAVIKSPSAKLSGSYEDLS